MKWIRLSCAALALLSASGCVAGERMIAGRKDYAMYRDYRLAETTLLRLRYGNRYLKDVPGGRFRDEVAAWFVKSDAAYYREAHDRPSLLRAYLAALPDGPHAEKAIDRLIELEMLREYRDKAVRREEEKLGAVTKELEAAARGRELLVKDVSEWLRALSSIQSFGSAPDALPPPVQERLRTATPPARCDAERCLNDVRVAYAVPANRRLVPREATFSVEIALERGVVRSAAVAGPALFSRLGEALALAPVEADDFSSRVDAIARSVALVGNVLEPRLPKATCEREAVAPLVLVRECGGVRVELFAGDEPGANDGFVIRASSPSNERSPERRGSSG